MSFKILEDEKNQKILNQQLEIDQLTEKLYSPENSRRTPIVSDN